MLKIKKISIIFLIIVGLLFSMPSYSQVQLGRPTFLPPDNVRNIMLLSEDLPHGFIISSRESYIQSLDYDGWPKRNAVDTLIDVVPGISQGLQSADFCVGVRYGYFETIEESKLGAEKAIFQNNDSLRKTLSKTGSFSGIPIGDSVFRWEELFEVRQGVESHSEDTAILSFNKGRYAVILEGGWSNSTYGTKDKTIFDTLALKCEKKIDVATALDNINSISPILHSLQVKLDAFFKNYRKGQYKPAVNEMNAFLNELEAQRGKKVSESDYQKLKDFANAIIMAVNSLM